MLSFPLCARPLAAARRASFVFRAAGAVLCLASALAGCGGSADPSSPSVADPASTDARRSTAGVDASAADTGWTQIATENQTFTVSGTQTVRYGSGSSWIAMTVTGGGTCSNAFFGSDPLFGVVKECDVAASAPTDGWTRIAVENQGFSVTGTQTVRYGSGSSWITRLVTGSGQCSNAWFGTDPLFGVVKECDVATASTTTAGVCTPPIAAVDTSAVAPSVGNGTPGSCTEAALRAAIASNDVVRFACGANPVTIPISAQIDLPTDRQLVIDGGGTVTLDGGNRTRIFSLIHPDYRRNTNGVTLCSTSRS